MKEKILQMVDAYWKFDEAQHPMSSWHDKQDLLKALEELLQPVVGNNEVAVCNCGLKIGKMVFNEATQELYCDCGKRIKVTN